MKNIEKFNEYLNENNSIETKIISFLNNQMEKDKKEYRGHIPNEYSKGSKWNNSSWIVDEIIAFVQKDYSSYVLNKFGKKYSYDEIDEVFKKYFKDEYYDALTIINDRL